MAKSVLERLVTLERKIKGLYCKVFDLKPKYKVFTALLTQEGESNIIPITSESAVDLIIGTTYTINNVDNDPGDFTNVGAPNNEIGTSFVATGTTPNSWRKTELIYDQGAPTAIVLENTIGNVWFTFGPDDGIYSMFTSSTFPENILYGTIGQYSGNIDGQGTLRNSIFSLDYANIRIQTQSTEDGTTWNFQNNLLYNTPIEIKVYN